MKKLPINLKYITFSLIFIIVSFAFTNFAFAGTYTYSCAAANGGGTITSVVSIGPPNSPYAAGSSTSFPVTVSITQSTCTAPRTVNLTAQNNSGTVYTIIANSILNPGGALGPFIDSIHFASPSTAGSSYAVHFITGVDEPAAPPTIYVRDKDPGTVSSTGYSNNVCFDERVYHYGTTTDRASFYSDSAGTVPLDVTGLGLRLIMLGDNCSNDPAPPGAYCTYSSGLSPVVSGINYDYVGYNFQEHPSLQYGCSTQDGPYTDWQSAVVQAYDNSAPVPYVLFPEAPTVNLIATPLSVYTGDSSNLQWNSTNATSCTLNGSSVATSGNQSTGPIFGNTTFTILCSNITGSDTSSVTITDIGPPPPPPPQCWYYPGYAVNCDPPSVCVEDPINRSPYEICQL